MNDISVVSHLISAAIDAEFAAKQAREKHMALYKQAAEQALHDALGEDLWGELSPSMAGTFQNDGYPDTPAFYVHVEAIQHQLAPFGFKVTSRLSHQNGHALTSADFTVTVANSGMLRYLPVEKLGEVLASSRVQFPEWNMARLEKLTAPLVQKLSNCIYPFNAMTPEEADKALAELVSVDPDQTDYWQELRSRWTERLAEVGRQEAEAAEKRAAQEAKIRAYGEAGLAYCRAHLAAAQANRALLAALQEKLAESGPVRYWKLTYATIAEDEEGETISTETVCVTDEPPQEDFWTVIERGTLRRVKYSHVVSIEGSPAGGPFEAQISDGNYEVIGRWSVPQAPGVTLYYRPGLDIRTVVKALNFQEFPEHPEMPYIGGYHWEHELLRQLQSAARETLIQEGFDPYAVDNLL